jgi:hypothetical protein
VCTLKSIKAKNKKSGIKGWTWWYKFVIPALRKLRQEDGKFEASLD